MPEIGTPPLEEPVDVVDHDDGRSPDPARWGDCPHPVTSRRHRRPRGPAGGETAPQVTRGGHDPEMIPEEVEPFFGRVEVHDASLGRRQLQAQLRRDTAERNVLVAAYSARVPTGSRPTGQRRVVSPASIRSIAIRLRISVPEITS